MLFAAADGSWAVGGGVAFLALVSLIRFLLSDRGASDTLHKEIAGLRKSLTDQSARHQAEMNGLRERQAKLEALYDEQRTLKHAITGDLAKAVMALEVVRRLSRNCTCQALISVEEIVDQLLNELSALRTRRFNDPQ